MKTSKKHIFAGVSILLWLTLFSLATQCFSDKGASSFCVASANETVVTFVGSVLTNNDSTVLTNGESALMWDEWVLRSDETVFISEEDALRGDDEWGLIEFLESNDAIVSSNETTTRSSMTIDLS